MNEQLADMQQLADSFKELSYDVYFVLLAIIIVVALWQTFTKGYLNKKFQNIANNEDFATLKRQLSENTEAVEEIKTSFWKSQQVWTKKHESFSTIVEHIFEIKALLNNRLNKNQDWLKSIEKDPNNPDLSSDYKILVSLNSTGSEKGLISKLEELEEKITIQSVFLGSGFIEVENKIKSIRESLNTINEEVGEIMPYENQISAISKVLDAKLNLISEVILLIRLMSDAES